MSPLVTHVLPKIGSLPAEQITQHDIVEVLKPLWHRNASVAAKALDRIGIVLMHGAAIDLDVDVTAKTKARAILGKQKHKVTHIASMPWPEIPAFYKQLCEDSSKSALALRLAVLTACRSQEVRGARIKEIDGDVWTVPAVRMKGGHAASGAAVGRGESRHRGGRRDRHRRLSFPRPADRLHLRHDDEHVAEAAGHRLPAARLSRFVPDMGGRGRACAPRGGRGGAGPYRRRQGRAVLHSIGLPRGAPRADAAVGRLRDRESGMKQVTLGSKVYFIPEEEDLE